METSNSAKGEIIMETSNSTKRWLILILMLASFAATFMTRFIWSPLGSTVAPILGISNTAVGSFMSAFFIGYVITQIPGGILADRVGTKYVLSAGVLITGLASIGMSLVTVYSIGFVIRVITGLGAGVVMSCCSKTIAENFEQSERGIAFGILLCGPTVGLTIANKLGVYLLTTYDWQTAFRVTGFIAVVIAILVFIFVKNIKSEPLPSGERTSLLDGIRTVFTNRNLTALSLTGFFFMFLSLGTATWANSYLTTIGFDKVTAGSIMTVYSIAGILASLLTGFIVKWFKLSVRNYLIAVFILIGIVTLLFGFQTNLNALMIIGFIFGFVSYLPNAHLNSLILKYSPQRLSGSVMGVQNCVFQLASIVAPIVIGMSVDITGAFRACWFTLAAAPIIGLIFLFMINDKKEAVE
ncbi:MFS transporter [Acetobacterium tundrae]|uniref:MFS transporter n=1 Tax=Acetobacterium tundrae TaxID=132932 RepID=A0ABR6WIV9_9FIRM|nr:MFS transporter [Acetobacterium tundrae]MBC3796228.1 MFS transporter [Acetobacterium tundrae]